ncbi:hypothetical protein F2Q68_00017509 [Brassica cretica]|uniref:Uncharacterized protein n=1 Tax=Brassica cretica TaxID=69181 RepID=A0A8S9HFE7_BRACR|nr:hypothetical protein F2Q68_00017509 [Brassica cretica]
MGSIISGNKVKEEEMEVVMNKTKEIVSESDGEFKEREHFSEKTSFAEIAESIDPIPISSYNMVNSRTRQTRAKVTPSWFRVENDNATFVVFNNEITN